MLLVFLAAAAQIAGLDGVPPSPPTMSPTGKPSGWHGHQQVFISPAGEPFRADEAAPYPVADWFHAADSNHDGKLTEGEFTLDFLRFCAALDTNHDGVIDSAELDRYETIVAPEVHSEGFGGGQALGDREGGGDRGGGGEGGHHRGGGGRGGGGHDGGRGGNWSGGSGNQEAGRPQGAGRYDLFQLPEPVAAMDTNLNGRITRQEMLDAAAYRFSLLDADHRGYLTLGDLPETYAQAHRKTFKARLENGDRSDRERHGGAGQDNGDSARANERDQ